MIVRNLTDPEVDATTYKAHGGGTAQMLLTSRELKRMLFLAHARLAPGRELEAHIDPFEEIYYILAGEGLMRVGEERERVKEGDAIWIPVGKTHSLLNDGNDDIRILVFAA